jgi:hypothetical protein
MTYAHVMDSPLPEHESVETFVEFCMDDERETFDHTDLEAIAFAMRTSRSKVRSALEGYGLRLEERPKERRFRTVNSNPHNRWEGNPCGGGSGWEQVLGFAGRSG